MYRHGVYVDEQQTGLITPVNVDSALPVIIGTAPVHNLAEGKAKPVNELKLIYSLEDFYAQFGFPEEGQENNYTLVQFAKIYLERYKLAPIVFINVFDPEVHIDADTSKIDLSLVTTADIIGGIDENTKKRTGLALAHQVFPKFRLVPGQIIAPKYSKDPAVAMALGSAAASVSGLFKAMGVAEFPDNLENFTKAVEYLNSNNLIMPSLIMAFGDYVFDNVVESASMHLAAVVALRDSESENIPFWSPSNKNVKANGLVYNNEPLELLLEEANYLNGNGIVTAINMLGGLVVWGNQTSCYPSNTDVRENSIPIRRMFNWIGNTLILSSWSKISSPIRRRFIESVQTSFNLWLNGLTAREYILGGRVTFEMVDNPTTDLVKGTVRWHVYVAPPEAGKELVFILEYDPAYLSTLFSVAA